MMQKVLVSIDVEAPTGENGVEKLIYGRIGQSLYGIDRLMDIFDENGITGLFFVDMCEAHEYGKERIIEVLRHIDSRGHDVGVHVHPDRMADKKRRFLWQYDFDEQYRIIKKATDLYVEALGRGPLSFRAGRYGADDQTISIIEKLGYKYDMSFFYGKRNCRITEYDGVNSIGRISGILEVPVTSFVSFSFAKYRKYEKIDCSLNYREHKYYLKKLYGKVDVISFFAHSFSLLRWRSNPNNPSHSKKLEKRLKKNLSLYQDKKSFCFISEKELESLRSTALNKQIVAFKGIRTYLFFLRTALRVLINRIINNI